MKNHKIILMLFFPEEGCPDNQDGKKKYKKSKRGHSGVYDKTGKEYRIEKIDRKYRKYKHDIIGIPSMYGYKKYDQWNKKEYRSRLNVLKDNKEKDRYKEEDNKEREVLKKCSIWMKYFISRKNFKKEQGKKGTDCKKRKHLIIRKNPYKK